MSKRDKEETLRRERRRREKQGEEINNFVAKSMNKYNKPRTHADLKKQEIEDRRKAVLSGLLEAEDE